MQYVDLDDIVKRVRTDAPACPLPLAERSVIAAARELCQRARVWRDYDEVTFSAGDACEYLCTIQAASIVQIEKALFDGRELVAITPADLDAAYPEWDFNNEHTGNPPNVYVQITPDTIQIYPRAAGKVRFRLWLCPAIDADVLPDMIVNHYADVIAAGAAGRVLMTPNMDFHNPQLGTVRTAKFYSDLDTLAYRTTRTQTGARLRTKPSFM